MIERFSVIGLGKVGKALALYFSRKGITFLGGYSSTFQTSVEAVKEIGIGKVLSPEESLEADLILITVPDDRIENVSKSISSFAEKLEGKYFLHCSGSRGKDILEDLRRKGAMVGVFHPLFPFFSLKFSLENLEGAYVGIDAPPQIFELAENLGFKPFPLPQNKVLYHAGAVFSAGMLAGYLSYPLEIARILSIPSRAYLHLASLVLKSLEERGVEETITGPWKRGDEKTIKSHLKALEDRRIYKILLERIQKILKEG